MCNKYSDNNTNVSIFGIYNDIDNIFINILDLDNQIKFSEINKYYYNLVENNIEFNNVRNNVLFPSHFKYNSVNNFDGIFDDQVVNKITQTIAHHCFSGENNNSISKYKTIMCLISKYNKLIDSDSYE